MKILGTLLSDKTILIPLGKAEKLLEYMLSE